VIGVSSTRLGCAYSREHYSVVRTKPDPYILGMKINVAIYARESADCSYSILEQIDLLQTVAVEHGWAVTRVFTDRVATARMERKRRPGEKAMLDAIEAGGVQKVLLLGIDRVGRSLADLVAILEACRTAGVGLYMHDQKLDTATSNGLTLFDLSAILVHHIRQSRRERILCGHAAARAASVRFGRPPIPLSKIQKAKQGLAEGKGVRGAARFAGISAASVSRIKATGDSCISL
jgi:DNA invertase Pin-like site-specific DNA recombinase